MMTKTQRNLLVLLAITVDILCIVTAAMFGLFPALFLYFLTNIVPALLHQEGNKQSY